MSNPAQPRILNGRYQLERKLGQGGMATVYLGRDLRLNRAVAIKVLHGQYASDEQFLRRFKHEADAAAQLGHPNIVRVYDVGADDDLHYIVMEYVQGMDLKEIITFQAPVPIPRTIKIVQQIAEALQSAHDNGLVHRDIKPQNVLMDGEDRVHLTDFGIAKSKLSSAMTDPGTTFGTADYLAPEQAQGLGATPLSDVYALGVVTYEMLTGRLPFTGDTPLAVALQHIQATPPALRQLNPNIPPQLETIVMQAMAKDPAQRPQSAREYAELLRTYRERGNQPTTVVPNVPKATPYTDQTIANPSVVRPQTPVQQPRVQQPRPDPRSVAPPLAPQMPMQQATVAPAKKSSGCGFFVVGLMLLAGIAGLLYVFLFTDASKTLANLFGGGAQPTAIVPTDVPPPTDAPMVQVPDLVGKSETDALQLLASLGLQERRLPPRNDPAPPGTVIEQKVAPNTMLPQGSVVEFVLSLGALQVDVPDITRQQVDSAIQTLEADGFKVERADKPDRTVPAGFVLSQNPPGNLKLAQGSTVQIVVSAGDVVEFPSVIGMLRADAENVLTGRDDVSLEFVDEQGADRLPNWDTIPANQVVSATANGQPVQNGQLIPRGSRIVLGVRKP